MARGPTNDRRRASVHLLKRVCAPVAWHRFPTVGLGLWIIIACFPAQAQQANQPGYDPRQTEKRFEDQQSSQGANGRPRLPLPQFARPEGQGDSKPLFVLRHVSITGAVAIPQERLVDDVSTLYREKGIAGRSGGDRRCGQRRLSRRRLSPQPRDRTAAGHPGRPASHSSHRRQHHGAGAEGRRR